MKLKTWAAILLIGGLLISWLKENVIWIILIIVILIVIRWLADLFWWGRDNGRW